MISQKNICSQTLSIDKKTTINKKKIYDCGWAYLMIAPTMIGLIVLNIWPLIQTCYLSFN